MYAAFMRTLPAVRDLMRSVAGRLR